MKETKKSLKVYFLVIGILGVLSTLYGIIVASSILLMIFALVYLILPAAFIYFGLKLDHYFEKSPKTLIYFVMISFAIGAIVYLISGSYGSIIFSGLIAWYLVHNIKKLSVQNIKVVDQK